MALTSFYHETSTKHPQVIVINCWDTREPIDLGHGSVVIDLSAIDIRRSSLVILWTKLYYTGLNESIISECPLHSFYVTLCATCLYVLSQNELTLGILTLYFFIPIAEPVTEIIGGPELYINKGSTINLTCIVKFAPEPPPSVVWSHNQQVSQLKILPSICRRKTAMISFLLLTISFINYTSNFLCPIHYRL